MKSETCYTAPGTKKLLAACLAMVLSAIASSLWAQRATTDTATAQNNEVVNLSPFEVESEKDYGYLKTNAATATRIGTEIQKVPLNISVISSEFINDTGMSDIQDLLRYLPSSAGDSRMGILQPATGATPSGNLSLRGFPINSRLRNGILRYSGYNLDTVERVEVVQGPAAVFFGQGYPGGVINYVTKRPQFTKIPTTLSYGYGGSGSITGSQRMTMDHNQMLSKKAALRIVSAWDHKRGDQKFEFERGYTFMPSLTLLPFDSGKLRINLELETMRKIRNIDDTSWIWRPEYFTDYKNPSAALITAAGVADAAAYRARIFNNYGAWINDIRKVAGNNLIPYYTNMERGAYYTDVGGNRIHDKEFNYYGVGSFVDNRNDVFQATFELAATDWMDVRYVFTRDNSWYQENKNGAPVPNADGNTFNVLNGNSLITRDYILETYDHQVDIILKGKFAGIDSKLLFGGVYRDNFQEYTGTPGFNASGAGLFPLFAGLPGAYSKPDEGYVSPIPANLLGIIGSVTNTQYVRDRAGKILSPVELFTRYDPAVHPFPDTRRINEVDRGLLDSYRPIRKDYYINYQGSMLDDRLHVFAGWRHEEQDNNDGQLLQFNPPWFTAPGGIDSIPQTDWVTYGFGASGNYALFSRNSYKSDSYMAGVSFAVTERVTLYASWSKTGVINSGTLGGDYDEVTVRARATELGRDPNTEIARLAAQGGRDFFKPEEGLNLEAGAKIATTDNKLVGTFSIFRGDRKNRKLDDSQRQLDEPLNYTAAGVYTARPIRWYNNSAHQRNEGAEFEGIWTPIRNYQAIVAGSWMWTSKVVADASILPTNPNYSIVFSNRLIQSPEYTFRFHNKYTFTDGPVRGLSIGAGARYTSEMRIGNDTNWVNGLTAGNYVVFDGFLSYPWELLGYKLNSSLRASNLLDKDYSEGGANLAPSRTWMLTTTLSF